MQKVFMGLILILSWLFINLNVKTTHAHEVWLAPMQYIVAKRSPIKAHIRNGQHFKGYDLTYFPNRAERLSYVLAGQERNIPARAGDRPALAFIPEGGQDGILTLLFVSQMERLHYSEWNKFVAFTDEKDIAWAQEEHDNRGLSREGFVEAYWRYAKALLAHGGGDGKDQLHGMKLEFLLEQNPYIAPRRDQLGLSLFWHKKPLADTQITIFARAPDGTISQEFYRSDQSGRTKISIKPGHEYLCDAVVIQPASEFAQERFQAVWETHWASLTFMVPTR